MAIDMIMMASDPALTSLRGDPRFAALLNRMGLPMWLPAKAGR
jgi:hypothetical protein